MDEQELAAIENYALGRVPEPLDYWQRSRSDVLALVAEVRRLQRLCDPAVVVYTRDPTTAVEILEPRPPAGAP